MDFGKVAVISWCPSHMPSILCPSVASREHEGGRRVKSHSSLGLQVPEVPPPPPSAVPDLVRPSLRGMRRGAVLPAPSPLGTALSMAGSHRGPLYMKGVLIFQSLPTTKLEHTDPVSFTHLWLLQVIDKGQSLGTAQGKFSHIHSPPPHFHIAREGRGKDSEQGHLPTLPLSLLVGPGNSLQL